MFLLLVITTMGDMARGAVFLANRAGLGDLPDPNRRAALARILAFGSLGGSLGASVVGIAAALGPVEVRKIQVPLKGLSPTMSGFRIAQLTDIHVGPTIGRTFLEQLVATTNAMKPDAVAITGDLVDGTGRRTRPTLAALGRTPGRPRCLFRDR